MGGIRMSAMAADGESSAVELSDNTVCASATVRYYAMTMQQAQHPQTCTAMDPLGLRTRADFLGGRGILQASIKIELQGPALEVCSVD